MGTTIDTEERTWLLDTETPDRLIGQVLAGHVAVWPLPHYLQEHLEGLAQVEAPTEDQVDEARIPLKNWFRQRREELLDIA